MTENKLGELMQEHRVKVPKIVLLCKVSRRTVYDWIDNKYQPNGKHFTVLFKLFGIENISDFYK